MSAKDAKNLDRVQLVVAVNQALDAETGSTGVEQQTIVALRCTKVVHLPSVMPSGQTLECLDPHDRYPFDQEIAGVCTDDFTLVSDGQRHLPGELNARSLQLHGERPLVDPLQKIASQRAMHAARTAGHSLAESCLQDQLPCAFLASCADVIKSINGSNTAATSCGPGLASGWPWKL